MSAQEIDTYTLQIAQLLIDRRALFVLWAVKILFCTTKEDFLHHYNITDAELTPLLKRLTVEGFLQEDDEHYILTQLGEDTVLHLGELSISQFAHPERLSREVVARFEPEASLPSASEEPLQEEAAHTSLGKEVKMTGTDINGFIESFMQVAETTLRGYEQEPSAETIAQRFWQEREHDRGKPEATFVELPFIQQLVQLGWEYQPGHSGAPELNGRRSFNDVVLEKYLTRALPRLSGQEWLEESHIQQMVAALKRVLTSNKPGMLQTNQDATELLLKGAIIPVAPETHTWDTARVHFIDFEHPERNQFLVINQFRVNLGGSRYIVPDIVLFVNGIPLVVVECKNPSLTSPVEEGITQLFRYSRRKFVTAFHDEDEAVPELFYFNQLLISTCFFQARAAALGASYEHFQEWKDPYLPEDRYLPVKFQHCRELLPSNASSQQTLIHGMLFPPNLLDLLYNFTIFDSSEGRTRKLVARYHQFRAVHKALHRLLNEPTRPQDGEEDRRGGIIWHTQGSGKSLTMAFLVRKMRTIEQLQGFKVVFVTDRKQLEQQLKTAARATDEPIRRASAISELEPLLQPAGPRLVFAMIQKYQQQRNGSIVAPLDEDDDLDEEASERDDEADPQMQQVNPGVDVLVIVDEGHRSQTRKLHANLRKMMPNCARIAFTGTPIVRGPQKKTADIFVGGYIDRYTIRESERDGATLPILYEGREPYIRVTQSQLLDDKYETLVQPFSRHVRESLQERNATYREILEAEKPIEKKAEDMLLHYTEHILPNGFKAMIVAVSRLAAIRYCEALERARKKVIASLDALPPERRNLKEREILDLYASDEDKTLMRIFAYRDLLAQLKFAAVVSSNPKEDQKDQRVDWARWTNEEQHATDIENFKKPLPQDHTNSESHSPLAFLCVRSMLITGFDAPIAQALYLDRSIKNHELLQAIARVNRLHGIKTNGLVVDYYGIAQNLKDALHDYRDVDVQGALTSIKDEYPLLADRHRRVMAIFESNHCDIHQELEKCVNLLKDAKIRSDFEIKYKKFMDSLETVLPDPDGLHYISDAERLGAINLAAAAVHRDEQLGMISIGNKVRKIIDEHIDVYKISQIIAPISIHDLEFARKFRRHQSDETNATEMAGFAREYLAYTYEQDDPAYYNKLSARLEAIIRDLENNWSEGINVLEAFIAEITRPREMDEQLKLDPRIELPFFGILEEEVKKGSHRFAIPVNAEGTIRELDESERLQLAEFTKMLVQVIRQKLAHDDDFWIFTQKREDLRKEIGMLLEIEGHRLLEPFTRREEVAARLVLQALRLTAKLRDA